LLDIAQSGPGNAQSITWALRNRSRAAAGLHHDVQKLEHDGGPIRTEQVKTIDATALDPDARDALKRALLAAQAAT